MIKTIKLDQSVCGVVEVHSSVQIDLCKTRLINGIDDDQLHKLIAGIVRKS